MSLGDGGRRKGEAGRWGGWMRKKGRERSGEEEDVARGWVGGVIYRPRW